MRITTIIGVFVLSLALLGSVWAQGDDSEN